MLLLAIIPATFAVNETTVSSADADTKIMTDSYGIKVRAYQLQRHIELAIFHARLITQKLSMVTNISTEDKQKFYDAVTELTKLKSEVAALSLETNKETAVTSYVDIKKRTITVIQDTKALYQKVFTAEQRATIKDKIKGVEADQTRLIEKKIEAAKRVKDNQVLTIYRTALGLPNATITELKEAYNKLTKERKEEVSKLR
jgi:hypothetical protein